MQLRKLNQQHKVQTEKLNKGKLVVKCGVGVFILVTILEIWLVNRLSTYGQHLSEIKQDQLELITKNQILENKLAKASSLNDLEKTAAQLGFTESKSLDYIRPQAVASR